MEKEIIINNSIVCLVKGINPRLLEELPVSQQQVVAALVQKELFILAESAQPGAASRLADFFQSIEGELTPQQVTELSAFVEFGMAFGELPPDLQQEAQQGEILDEMNHFSRIMSLDRILVGNLKFPMTVPLAKAQCKEFARFLWLIFERRNQKLGPRFDLRVFPRETEGNFALQDGVGVFKKVKTDNLIGLVFSVDETSASTQAELKRLIGVLEEFCASFSFEQALFLFDLFLFLIQVPLKCGFVCLKETVCQEGVSTIKAIGTAGTVLTLIPSDTPFEFTAVRNQSLVTIPGSSFGQLAPSLIQQQEFRLPAAQSRVIIAPPTSILGRLTESELLELVNSKDRHGKVLVTNNIRNFLQANKTSAVFQMLRTNSPQVQQQEVGDFNNVFELPNELFDVAQIVVESAHIHADRDPSVSQLQTIELRNQFVKQLTDIQPQVAAKDILMIDDLHVVNRIDYQAYLSVLAQQGFQPDEVVLESSPLIRAVAVDVVQELFQQQQPSGRFELMVKGSNLYLVLQSQRVIELIGDVEGKNQIGCVLFDVAFTLYKRNVSAFQRIFNQQTGRSSTADIHQELIEFYQQNPDPIQRQEQVESLFTPFPSLMSLQDGARELQFLGQGEENAQQTAVVNIHEVFYRPQQAKVNAVLDLLEQPRLFSIYLNPQKNDVLIEQSTLEP